MHLGWCNTRGCTEMQEATRNTDLSTSLNRERLRVSGRMHSSLVYYRPSDKIVAAKSRRRSQAIPDTRERQSVPKRPRLHLDRVLKGLVAGLKGCGVGSRRRLRLA